MVNSIDLSVVVTTRDRIDDLRQCVQSIEYGLPASFTYELIIVDDNSNDQTRSLKGSDFSTINTQIVHNPTTLMLVRSRNIGARLAKAPYILFIDDDNVIDKNMIATLYDQFLCDNKLAIAGPTMYFFDSKEPYMHYQKLNLFTGKTTGYVDTSGQPNASFLSDGIPNVFMLRRSILDRCGYFDEELLQTFTEPDYALSIRRQGFHTTIFSNAKVYHKISKKDYLTPRALGGQFSQKGYCLIRNRTIVVFRYGTNRQKLIYLFVFSWLWPVLYSIILFRSKRWDVIRLYWLGFMDGIYFVLKKKIRNSCTRVETDQKRT